MSFSRNDFVFQKKTCRFRSLLKNAIGKRHVVFCLSKMTCRFLLKSASSNWVKQHVIFQTSENDMSFLVNDWDFIYWSNDMSFSTTTKMTCFFMDCNSCMCQKKHAIFCGRQNNISFGIVFFLQSGSFWPVFNPFQLDFNPNSIFTLWTPNSMFQNPYMIEIQFPNDF